MPTYEYHCNSCNHEFEKFQGISDPPTAECPSCGSTDTSRLVSCTSFILKGTGWYVTDYARKERRDNGSSSKPSSEPSSKKAASSN